ncbi:MAG: methyl-accepting chemotaxis protein, partial [Blastochloris sp.]|nr:methyl-accepting chemotaxis protein [Blastochloris sp.]
MSTPSSTLPPPSGLTVTLKIALVLIGIGTLATLVTALIAYILFANVQEETVKNNLNSVRSLMEQRINSHVEGLLRQTQTLSESSALRQILLVKASDSSDPNVANTFKIFHTDLTGQVRNLRYHSLYLCTPEGRVLYNTLDPDTAIPDFSLFGTLARDTLKSRAPVLLPSERGVERGANTLTESTLFVAAPVLEGERVIAILITESSFAPLNSITTFNDRPLEANLGSTVQAFLVDPSLSLRSRSTQPEGTKIQTEGVRNAMSGNSGASLYDNVSGLTVLGSYNRLKIDGMPWGILVEQSKSEALAPARSAAIWVAGVGFIIIILVGISGFAFAKIFAQPIVNLQDTIRRVAAGDESVRAVVERNDEIGQLAHALNEMIVERNAVKDRISTENKRVQANIQDFLLVVADASEGKLSVRAKRTEGLLGNVADALNRMLENVSVLIGQAKSASSQVQDSAGEIAGAAQNLADGATSQTTQIAETIVEVQNLAAEAQGVSENSQEAARAASRTRQAAEEGAKAVRDVIAYMERLQESVQNNARKITRLGERSQEISGIVRSISDISAETDVLAMNASIE